MKLTMQKYSLNDLYNSGYIGPVLAPVDVDMNDIPNNMVMVEVKASRNPGNHRRFFSFINTTFDMQDEFEDIDVWRKYIQMKAGFFDEVVTGKGKVMYWPKSISWEKLDEIEFKKLFEKVFNAFTKYYGHNLSQQQLDTLLQY